VSYVRHEAIVVSSWNRDGVKAAHELAASLPDLQPTPIVKHGETWTFLIPPEGSKAGWLQAQRAAADRETWRRLIKQRELFISWVCVRYPGIGDEDYKPRIVDFDTGAK